MLLHPISLTAFRVSVGVNVVTVEALLGDDNVVFVGAALSI